MKVSFTVGFRPVLGVLAATLSFFSVSGCGGGGWGESKPTIAIQQSQAQTVIAGQSATFTVTATGTGPFKYLWYLNGTAINGSTSASYTTGATVSSQNGSVYTVAVTDAGGTVMSAPYVLTVNSPAAITAQPTSQTVIVGKAATFTVTATGTAPLSYQWYQGGAAISNATASSYTTPATTTIGSSVYTVIVTNLAGTVTSATATLTVVTEVPTLSFAPIGAQIYGAAAFAVSATSASSGAVNYTVVSGPATIAGSTVTLTGAGTVMLSASQVANGNYAAATTTTSFTVAGEVPTLSFATIAAKTYGAPAFAVSATSASSGVVTYTVVSGPATIAGSTVTLTGAGTVMLSANQAASGNYALAAATTSFTVATEVPTLSFATIAAKTYGAPAFAVSATSASSGAVTYTVVSGPATILADMVTLTGTGTVVLSASQVANGNYAAATTTTSFTVATEVPTLSFATIAAETYGNAAFAVSATSASSGAVSYSVVSGPATIVGSIVTLTGAGTVVLTASQVANSNFAAATTTTSFTVATEVPTLSFATIPTETYGTAPFTVSTTSMSSSAVTYTVASGPATIVGSTVTPTGAGTVVLTASQAANVNYAAATATTSFTVAAEVPTLSFATIAAKTYGAPAFAVSATSASRGAVSYSVANGPATIAGSTVTLTGAGTVVLAANQAATGNYAAATATTSFTVAPEVPTLSFATIPAETYGNAAFPVSATSASIGAVTYTVVSGPAIIVGSTVTLTGAGTVVLSASQAANGNYAAATTTTSFTVVPSVTITPITPANSILAPGSQTLSATASNGALTWTADGGTITAGGVWTSPSAAGTYTIMATSVDEPSVSASTTVTISKPVIIMQPVSENVCSGYSSSLTIGANYATSYQWTLNGSNVGTESTIILPDATSANDGSYICTATSAAGSTASNAAVLNVLSPTTLTITGQPSSVSVYATQTATFSVAATGTGTLAYQWYTGTVGSGTAIGGAISSTYTTPALTTANSGTSYYATVKDPNCTGTTLTSTAATLLVTNTDTAVPPTIVVQPTGQTATVDGTATFSVTASGTGTLSYQWYRVAYSSTELSAPTAGVAISGATNSSYTVPSSETAQSNDGDNYYAVVTNHYGSAVTNRVVLAVGAGILLQITAEPQTEYVATVTLASFSVTATCTACIPAYQWYWYAPGSTTATALSNGAVSSGALFGATVAGATTSSLTLENVPTTAYAALFYVVVTSTSDGTTQISGTNPLTSTTAGLFVGPLGTVGNTTADGGLCNNSTSSTNWVLNGKTNGAPTAGTASGDVPYQNTSSCTIELTNDQGNEQSSVYWPSLISTAKFTVSFTVAIAATGTPADGFTMVLADPSQGATTSTIGTTGEGLGADGIQGFVLGFDTHQNGNLETNPGCSQSPPCDPMTVPYMAVGQGASTLWENPWTFVNGYLNTQSSADYGIDTFANASHTYVVTVVNSIMTVTMDGYELFTGRVSLPPAAYLGFTASTGTKEESVTISALTATVSAP
jgi:hypothetical protein